ncbi:MAG TPA: hypothetical protein VMZ31_16785 [Phycisphaerae bacterium]|nr:hypothetical protein [Phycisphaerae bacterium]
MKCVSAVISFLFVFVAVFFLAGWFLMPHLPPVPDRPISVFEGEYWADNWIGALLGLVLGGLSARSVLKKAPAKEQAQSNKKVKATDKSAP